MSQKITAFQFDATKVAPQAAMEAVPENWYIGVVSDADLKLTEGGSGQRIALELTITEGPFKGRKAFDGLNIVHSSAQAQQIAAGQFSAICHAVSVFQVTDLSMLFNKPFQFKLGLEAGRWVDADNNDVEPNTPNSKYYEAKNRFRGAKALGAGGPVAGAAPAVGAPGLATPSWAVGAPAAAAAPAAPVAPAKVKGKPGRPAKAAAAPAPVSTRKFFVGLDGAGYENAFAEADIVAMLGKGMPPDTALCLEGESDWKTAADYAIGAAPAPAAAAAPVAAAPAAVVPPWLR